MFLLVVRFLSRTTWRFYP